MDATVVGSFRGEFMNNPLPINTTFVLNNPDACKGLPDLQYNIYVHSAPKNVERRKIMRSTWPSKTLFKKQITKYESSPECQKLEFLAEPGIIVKLTRSFSVADPGYPMGGGGMSSHWRGALTSYVGAFQ